MEKKSSHFLKLAGTVLVATLTVSLIILVIGLIAQWNDPVKFSNAFFIAGAVVVVLGFLSIWGGFAQRANFNVTFTETAGNANLSQRAQRTMGDIMQRYGAMTLFGVVGILLILISVLIGTFLIY